MDYCGLAELGSKSSLLCNLYQKCKQSFETLIKNSAASTNSILLLLTTELSAFRDKGDK